MLADMPWSKRELFKTDIKNIYINLNENFTIRNKWNKMPGQNGIHAKIIEYRERNQYPLKASYDNEESRFVTYKYYKQSLITYPSYLASQ